MLWQLTMIALCEHENANIINRMYNLFVNKIKQNLITQLTADPSSTHQSHDGRVTVFDILFMSNGRSHTDFKNGRSTVDRRHTGTTTVQSLDGTPYCPPPDRHIPSQDRP